MTSDETVDRNPVEQLAAEFADRLRRGECPSISEYVEQHPDLAAEIEEVLPTVVAMEQLRKTETNERNVAQATSDRSQDLPEQIGDYRILREIGRGGMGIVYEAEQKSLKRRVALKVLSTNGAPRHLERFRREAESAGRLHHTNIVPVFGTGEDHSIHYYVMQFIDGVGLDEVLVELNHMQSRGHKSWEDEPDPPASEEKSSSSSGSSDADSQSSVASFAASALQDGTFASPKKPGSSRASWHRVDSASSVQSNLRSQNDDLSGSSSSSESHPADETKRPFNQENRNLGRSYWKSIARIGVQLADALQYAHGHGILHRDIKPSNLLLDRDGVVWITDFGLVKPVDHEAVTNTGDIVGTLRYMAPEQFDGRCDPRSEIYSLGLTLYELITLEPAFDDSSQKRLLRQRLERPVPPPRSLYRDIPRDLETIVMKATAAEPEHRYQKAGELAEDLQRFLEDRPISARRVTPVEQLWRWSRRNPALAIWSGSALSLLLVVAIGASAMNIQISRALTRAENATDQARNAQHELQQVASEEARQKELAQRAQQRAVANLNLAIEAFDRISTKLASRGTPQSLNLDLEDEELPQHDITLTSADAALLKDLLTFYERFAKENDDDDDLRVKTANAYHRMGNIFTQLGEVQQAEDAYHHALQLYQKLLQENPRRPRGHYVIATADLYNQLGIVYGKQLDFRRALESHQLASRLLRSQLDRTDPDPDLRFALAKTYDLQGSISIRNVPDRAIQSPPPRIGDPRNGDPNNDDPRDEQRRRGESRRGGSRPQSDGQDRNDRAERFGRTTGSGPDGVADRGRGSGRGRGGGVGDRPPGYEHLEMACQLLAELVAEYPANDEYRLALAVANRHLFVKATSGWRRAETRETTASDSTPTAVVEPLQVTDEARRTLETALDTLKSLVDEAPDNPEYLFELADTLAIGATRLASLQPPGESERQLQESIEKAKRLTNMFPNVPAYRALLANSNGQLASLQYAEGNLQNATGLYIASRSEFRSLAESYPADSLYQTSLADISIQLGEVQRLRAENEEDQNQLDASRRTLEQAVNQLQPYVEGNPKNRFGPGLLENLYTNLASTYDALGQAEKAEQARDRARDERIKLGERERGRGRYPRSIWRAINRFQSGNPQNTRTEQDSDAPPSPATDR